MAPRGVLFGNITTGNHGPTPWVLGDTLVDGDGNTLLTSATVGLNVKQVASVGTLVVGAGSAIVVNWNPVPAGTQFVRFHGCAGFAIGNYDDTTSYSGILDVRAVPYLLYSQNIGGRMVAATIHNGTGMAGVVGNNLAFACAGGSYVNIYVNTGTGRVYFAFVYAAGGGRVDGLSLHVEALG